MKIKTKIMVFYIILFSLFVTLIGYFVLNSLSDYLIKNAVNRLNDQVYINQEIYIRNPYGDKNPLDILIQNADSIASSLSKGDIRVKLYDKNKLLSDSIYGSIDLNEDKAKDVIDKVTETALNGHKAYTVGYNNIYFASPINISGTIIGAVEYIYPMMDEFKILNFIRRTFEISGIVAIILIILISIYLSNLITNPLNKLIIAVKKFSSGDFNRINISSKDEVGKLTETFNLMAETIKEHINEINKEKEKLNTVLSNMSDIVIAYDNKNNIIFKSKNIEEISKNKNTDFLKDIICELKNQKRIIKDINVGNKIFKADCLNSEIGYIIVLTDVTGDRELIKKQREFVSYISHELKTPITAISGYIDIIESDMKYDKTIIEYLKSESNRLKDLILQLLESSRLQNYEYQIDKRTVNASDILNTICKNMSFKASKFNISISTKIEKNVIALADPDKLSNAIINLLDNALKYSKPNSNIYVSLSTADNKISIIIKDNGIGIPNSEIKRIFDRFYRAKNALSIGGSGLGLSIVKEIIEKHGGNIIVNSEINKGSTFKIILPYDEN